MSHLDVLYKQIKQLLNEAKSHDAQQDKPTSALFDRYLFKCRSRYLVPCVNEALSTYQDIKKTQLLNSSNKVEQVEHLSSHLLNQLSAIKRELATGKIRNEIPYYQKKPEPSLEALYLDLAQHIEWERRLTEMAKAKADNWRSAPKHDKAQAKKSVILVEQRLIRCQTAKKAIETDIQLLENQ